MIVTTQMWKLILSSMSIDRIFCIPLPGLFMWTLNFCSSTLEVFRHYIKVNVLSSGVKAFKIFIWQLRWVLFRVSLWVTVSRRDLRSFPWPFPISTSCKHRRVRGIRRGGVLYVQSYSIRSWYHAHGVISVNSMVYLRYTFSNIHLVIPAIKAWWMLKMQDVLITLSRSFYNVKTPKHHIALGKYAELLCVNQK